MMQNKHEAEQEKSMYAICFSTLAIGLFLLAFLNYNMPISITGFAAYGTTNNKNVFYGKIIDYENISLENITQEMALDAILQAEKDIQEMQEAGFGIAWANDTLIEAKKYFEGENYTALLKDIEKINDTEKRENAKKLLLTAQKTIGVEVDYKKVLEKTKSIDERKKKAYEIKDLARASELRIQEFKHQGLDTSKVEEVLANALEEFRNERYDNSEALLGSIDKKLIDISAEKTLVRTIYKAGKENLIVFLNEYYKLILLVLGSLLVILILLYNRVMMIRLRHKIKDLKIEEEVLNDLMKKSQTDYFAKGEITKQTFEIKNTKYKERLAEIKQKLPVAESLLEKRLKSKRVL